MEAWRGRRSYSTKRRLGRVVGECDSDEPVSGRVWLT
jgi:hypothetical protein